MTADHTTYASDATAQPVTLPVRSGFTYGRAAKSALALAVGLVVGLAVQTWQQSESVSAAWARISAWAMSTPGALPALPPVQLPPSGGIAALPAPAVTAAASASAPRPAVDAPRLQASVMVGDERVALNAGRIALPSGTRFHLSVVSSMSGTLELHTVNPNGVVSEGALWSGPVRAGAAVETPGLRLDGTRGLETVLLVLRTPGGDKIVQRQVKIWHL